MEKLMLGAGCFWGVEHELKKLKGVQNLTVGYSGGEKQNPTYEEVCTDKTGHAEVVYLEYNPEQVSTEEILEKFWQIHDPTQLNRQGVDVGTQYRSVIFYYNEAQREAAITAKEKMQNTLNKPVVTEVSPAKEFWPAEEYHQCYFEKNQKL